MPETTRRSARPPAVELDEVDRALLGVLAGDGRISMRALAERINLSRAATYERVRGLERDGAIVGYTVRTDPHVLGLDLVALLLVHVDQHAWRDVRERFADLPGVEWVGLTTGEFDFVLLVRAPDVAHLRDVVLEELQGMPEVRNTRTIFVLDEDDRRAGGPLPAP